MIAQRGQHEHHHEIDNGMDGFCGFPFDKPCVGNVNPHHQNENQQEPDIKSSEDKPPVVTLKVCIFFNGIRRRGNGNPASRLPNQIPCGVGKVQADCPDKICDGIQPVHHLFSDTVQPVPREPVPSAVHIKIKLVLSRGYLLYSLAASTVSSTSPAAWAVAEDCKQQRLLSEVRRIF